MPIDPDPLIDPFLDTTPSYSPDIAYTDSIEPRNFIDMILAYVNVLTDGGWTQENSAQSNVTQNRVAIQIPIRSFSAGPIVTITSDNCKETIKPLAHFFSIGDIRFVIYDPDTESPPACSGDGNLIWVPAGSDIRGTCQAMCDFVVANTDFTMTFDGPNNPLAIIGGDSYAFTITPKDVLIEKDDQIMQVGAGHQTCLGGYYRMLSGAKTGHLVCLLISNGGEHPDKITMRVEGSGGGFYEQAWFVANYTMVAGTYWFAIWRTDNSQPLNFGQVPCMIYAALMDSNYKHMSSTRDAMFCIGSYNGDLNTDFYQLQKSLHWENSLSTGYSNTLVSTYFHSKVPTTNHTTPSIIFRGIRNAPLYVSKDAPLIEAPYVALASTPNGPGGCFIAGKLFDAVVVTGLFDSLNGGLKYQGKNWVQFSSGTRSGDLSATLWFRIS